MRGRWKFLVVVVALSVVSVVAWSVLAPPAEAPPATSGIYLKPEFPNVCFWTNGAQSTSWPVVNGSC